MELRALGSTGIRVSPIGLGTVKLGRNQQVKYPQPFDLPDDRRVVELLALARDLGINLLDTAPAYGTAQARLGQLLPRPREDWVIVSKVGEFFAGGQSRFDFTYATTVRTVEESLRALGTDYLDCVLIHSDGDDVRILEEEGVVAALQALKQRGLIRAHGMSTKTLQGGLAAVQRLDVVMATCSLDYRDEVPVLEAAGRARKGVLVKKALASGRIAGAGFVDRTFGFLLRQPGVASVIVGTINPAHLKANAAAAEATLAAPE